MTMKKTIGVVIGRFQSSRIHPGYMEVLGKARRAHNTICVLVGTVAGIKNIKNPLTFETRATMIKAWDIHPFIFPLQDHRCDKIWSQQVDATIELAFGNVEATLYFGRDSSADRYHGKHKIEFVDECAGTSSTKVRAEIFKNPRHDDPQFREGFIHAYQDLPPRIFNTVDIAVINPKEKTVLFGFRKHEGKCRFIGGFVDGADFSFKGQRPFESAAYRELREEAGDFDVTPAQFLSSFEIDDWRTRGTKDRTVTSLFVCDYNFGRTKAGDDIDQVFWAPFSDLENLHITDEHKPLLECLIAHLTKRGIYGSKLDPSDGQLQG